ncbi:hypothetical protein QGN32_23215 [Mycolicibacterium sp. ND9-15]|uniref:hypothetical protein n=1 Tax=Mycolicibacterium sp. ND9-15 TaxID=3042320 RepID=UPI002DD800C3|nr:hypothetical protein [Mycolicibacterium sp. ND9-15]WSE56205.1 hypothetical protein QGN32_23215 [Mycolicibacterium sp. ND9-15]
MWLLLAVVAAPFVYVIGVIDHRCWPFVVLGAMFLVGLAFLVAGRCAMGGYPVQAVFAIQFSALATVAVTTAVIVLGLWGEEVARRHFEFLPAAQQEPLDMVIGTAIAAVIAFLLINRFDEQLNALVPAGQTRRGFEKAFSKKLTVGSQEYQAVFEDHVTGVSHSHGWALRARVERAKVLARLTTPPPPPAPPAPEPPEQTQN